MNDQQTKAAAAAGIKILGTSLAWQDRWLTMEVTDFLDRNGQRGSWSFAGRVGSRRAVVILARNHLDELIVIRQFRIPLLAWVYEFPAGLVDDGEDPGLTAVRELQEETGYQGVLKSLSPPLTSSSGMTTETFQMAEVSVDGGPGEHDREGAEAIELVHVPRGGESAFIAQAVSEGSLIDGKLWTYLRGQSTTEAL